MRSKLLGLLALVLSGVVFGVPFLFIVLTAGKTRAEASRLEFSWPTQLRFVANFVEVVQRATTC